jgi:murein DD-endopeptidase MepM/ murein hydrolase activator NlpD
MLFAPGFGSIAHADSHAAFFEHRPIPGGIAIVDLGEARGNSTPIVKFGQRLVAVVKNDGHWNAVVGIPLQSEPGEKNLIVKHPSGEREVAFTVDSFEYEEQRIIIKDKNKVNPASLDLKRIQKENKRIAEVKAYRYKKLLSEQFQLPVDGVLSSPFGLKRFFNGQARRPHGGLDFAAPTGTPIYAPATGLVVDTGDYFFNGNSIFLEHGLGLQSFYAHLSKIHVKPGDKVKPGDLIGEVGATGRVTGPHLHWSVGLNGTWVDPNLVLP